MHIYIYVYIYIYIDKHVYIYKRPLTRLRGMPKCIFLVLLINRNSLRGASYLVFQTMVHLNCLKPCIISSSRFKP